MFEFSPCPGPTVPVTGDPNWSITEFETTPIMSTYLLAYIVSEFKNVETRAPSGILVRSWARPPSPGLALVRGIFLF